MTKQEHRKQVWKVRQPKRQNDAERLRVRRMLAELKRMESERMQSFERAIEK